LGVGSVWISEGGGAGASSSKNVVAGDKSKEKDADGSGNANIKLRNKSKGKMNKSTPAQKRKIIAKIEPAQKKKGKIQSSKSQNPQSLKLYDLKSRPRVTLSLTISQFRHERLELPTKINNGSWIVWALGLF